MTTASITSFETLGSRNLELQNALLSHQVLSAFIGNVEYMQNQLLIKMDDDRARTDMLKERLSLQQDLARQVADPEKDDKSHIYFISFDGSTVPPFENWRYAPTPGQVPNGISSLTFNGMGVDEIMLKGGKIWFNTAGEMLSGKQLYAYYDQQAEATKSAMSALNSVTSQDNLTLQSLRSKVDSNTQLLSTIIKNEKDRKEGVMRNM
jgi:hypothetical protein